MKITGLKYSVHPIDIAINAVQRETISDDGDLAEYVTMLIGSKMFETEGRKFEWKSATAPIPKLLSELCAVDGKFEVHTQTLAERLHEKERDAQKKVAQLKVQVQRGSLLQIIFRNNNRPHVLLVKVHLAQFLGEKNYKKQNGFPLENTVLKMALIEFTDEYLPDSVSIADSNAQLAEYWWKELLELTELTTDEYNTKTALNAMDSLLGRKLKKDHRTDYYHLRNNLLGYFRTNGNYNHTKMLTQVFGDYQPVDSRVKIEALRDAAAELPARNKFDPRFSIQPEFVNKRRKTTIALTEQIDLEIKDAIENMRDTIHAATLQDGTRGVFIRSPEGFDVFGAAHTNESAITTQE